MMLLFMFCVSWGNVFGSEVGSSVSSNTNLMNGLVSYWPMDDVDGLREDVHGEYDLVCNGVTSSSGIQSGASQFFSEQESFLQTFSDFGFTKSSDNFSYSLWFKTDKLPPDGNIVTLISRWLNANSEGTFFDLDYFVENPTLLIRSYFASNAEYLFTHTIDFDSTLFHHVVASFNVSDNISHLYVDGKLVSEGFIAAGDAGGNQNSFLEIGRFRDGNGNLLPRYFDGAIDEVGFWNRALTAEEVTMLYNDGKGLPYQVGDVVPEDAVSSVAFLPGIMASRLYTEDREGDERKRWESVLAGDIEMLGMREDGTSQSTVLYTKDVIDDIRPITGLGSFGDAYDRWIHFMDGLVANGTLKEWKALPYDWRLATDELFLKGWDMGEGKVSYVGAPPTPEGEGGDTVPYMLEVLEELAQNSPTGKVTIVAHSNGGLVAKNVLRYLETTHHPLLDKIDTLVLVASPQAGTPKALREILHGVDMPAQQTLRDAVEYMPGAYGLLPSPHLMTVLEEPVVETSESVSMLPLMQDMAGTNITTYDDLRKFLTGELGTRSELSTLGYLHPNLLSAALIASSSAMHAGVDEWTPPAHIRVVQVVGTGLWTPRGVAYSAYDRKTSSGGMVKSLRTEWLANMAGDGTVLAKSAESGNVDETYYLGMSDYNEFADESYAHMNILSTAPVQVLIEDVVLKKSPNVPLYMNTTGATDAFPHFEMRVYSPLDIHLYRDGKHTGVTNEPSTDMGRYTEIEIPNSFYEEWVDVKYAGAGLSRATDAVLTGTGDGEFTLEIDMHDGDGRMETHVWTNVPVRSVSKGTMVVDEDTAPILAYDYDGDGTIDAELASGDVFVPRVTYSVSFAGLRAAIYDAEMARVLETWFLGRVTLAEQLVKKGGKGNKTAAKVILETIAWSAEKQSGKGLSAEEAETIAKLARAVRLSL